MPSGVGVPGYNLLECHSVKVETYWMSGEVYLDTIDIHINERSNPIRLRPVATQAGVLLEEIQVFTIDDGRKRDIKRVTGKHGGFPLRLRGTKSTKGGPKS